MTRRRAQKELSIEAAREDPVALLNAGEQELRDLFGEVLGETDEIEEAIEFVSAWRELFQAATTNPRDRRRENEIVNRKLLPRWRRLAPWVQQVPQVDPMPDGQAFLGLTIEREASPVWWCLEERSMNRAIRLMAEHGPVVWEHLWAAYGDHRGVRCAQCQELFTQTRSDRVFCSDRCRVANWQRDNR